MDDAAFARLMEESMPSMYRVAMSILRRQADAQDAVQQALLNAWTARGRARRDAERAWLMRILINECRNIQRYRMRVLPLESMPETPYTPPDTALRDAVEALPDKLRVPFLLKYMEGMSEKEICAALRLSLPCVKSRLLRARRALEGEAKEQ